MATLKELLNDKMQALGPMGPRVRRRDWKPGNFFRPYRASGNVFVGVNAKGEERKFISDTSPTWELIAYDGKRTMSPAQPTMAQAVQIPKHDCVPVNISFAGIKLACKTCGKDMK